MSTYLGTVAAEDQESCVVIGRIEQFIGGDTVLTVGTAFRRPGGEVGQLRNVHTLRLIPTERETLIQRLIDHRFRDLADSLGR